MNQPLKNEITEICLLSILKQSPRNGFDLVLELDKYIGLKNIVHEHCFYYLRKNGYCMLVFEEYKGEKQGVYYITPKGLSRLTDFLNLKKSIDEIYNLLLSI